MVELDVIPAIKAELFSDWQKPDANWGDISAQLAVVDKLDTIVGRMEQE